MKRQSNSARLGDLVDGLMKAYGYEHKMAEMDALAAWEQLMGAPVAKYTRHLNIRNGVLHLYLDSSVLREELRFGREKIIREMNNIAGREIIRDVEFH
jgi:predicted nucleic acid-binding Zn ribbon protein